MASSTPETLGAGPPLASQDLLQVGAIVLDAAALDPGEREAFLRQMTLSRPALLAEVRRRLELAAALPESFLAVPAAELLEAVEQASDPPDTRPRYEPEECVGEGGMARVHKAFDHQLQRRVALKFLDRIEPDARRRFLREAQAQARVRHDNVLEVYETGELDGRPFIAMRWVDGPTLLAIREETSLEQKVRLIAQVAEGLHEAHREGLTHRDVKPSNILVERTPDGDWKPWIADFGIASWSGGMSGERLAERLFGLGQSEFWVGYVAYEKGDLAAGRPHFEAYRDLSERLVRMEPQSRGYQLELAYAHSNLGSLERQAGDLAKALGSFEETLAIKQRLAAQSPADLNGRFELAATEDLIGLTMIELGRLDEARPHLAANLELRRGLVEADPESFRFLDFLGTAHDSLAVWHEARGELDEALEQALQSQDLLPAGGPRSGQPALALAARAEPRQGGPPPAATRRDRTGALPSRSPGRPCRAPHDGRTRRPAMAPAGGHGSHLSGNRAGGAGPERRGAAERGERRELDGSTLYGGAG